MQQYAFYADDWPMQNVSVVVSRIDQPRRRATSVNADTGRGETPIPKFPVLHMDH